MFSLSPVVCAKTQVRKNNIVLFYRPFDCTTHVCLLWNMVIKVNSVKSLYKPLLHAGMSVMEELGGVMLSAASFAINVGNDTSMFRHWIGWFFWHAQMTQRQKMVLKACWRARAVSCCTDKCKIEVKINPKSKVKLKTSILEVFFSWNRLRASNI